MSVNENTEIMQEFVLDCRDLLENLEVSVINLGQKIEVGETDSELINTIFRAFHSIKGSAGFLMLTNIKEVAHAGESLLDNIRSGKIGLLSEHIEMFVDTADFMKEAIDMVSANNSDEDMSQKAAALKQILVKATEIKAKKGDGDSGLDVSADTVSQDITKQFVSESRENIAAIEQNLIKWGDGAEDEELLRTIFRLIHTFKGNCGFLGFADLEHLSHKMETVMDCVISKVPIGREQVVKTFLHMTDLFQQTLQGISAGKGGEIERAYLYIDFVDELMPKGLVLPKSEGPKVGEILFNSGMVTQDTIDAALEIQNRPIGKILVDMGAVKEEDVDNALNQQKQMKPLPASKTPPPAVQAVSDKKQDLRVDIGKLDALINLIGELVISHNMIIHNPEINKFAAQLESFTKANQQMSKIVRELQETAMFIRMIPVSGMFKRMVRLVHDLSVKSGKKVDFRLVGEETEIDKTVIELVTDPIVHIIRNSMDHGLETAEERTKTGKPEKGTVTLTAKHEEGEVWIIIEDDGKGINRDKVLKKAIEKGMIEGDGSQLKDRDIYGLIFQPGFSTTDQITDISGRGVGMDVVKKNMEKIKGRVDIDSKAGVGTKVTLRIPLTLAIIEGMMVRVGDVQYTIPILSIKEFCKPKESMITVSPDGMEIIRLRNETIQIIRLHEMHKIKPRTDKLSEGIIIIIESNKQVAALFVEEILGQQQTVIKGLSEYFGRVQGVSGCTILGDGTISLILDIGSLFQMALIEQ